MKSNPVCFIIVTYNPDLHTMNKLLRSLGSNSIIIIDNTEAKNNQFIHGNRKKLPPTVSCVTTEKNLGYAGGVNVGLRKAYDRGFAWMVVLNDDIEVSTISIHSFLKQLVRSPIGIAGVSRRYLDPKRWTGSTYPLNGNTSTYQYLSGSFFAIHRDAIHDLGILYEPYFLYYEETEYCIRAQRRGFPLTYIPIEKFTHNESSRIGKGSKLHQYYLARNHLLFVQRNAPVAVILHEIFRMPKTFLEHFGHSEWGALEGIRDFLCKRFGQYEAKV